MAYVNDGADAADEQWIYPFKNVDDCSNYGGQDCAWSEATCLYDENGDGFSDNFYYYKIDLHN